MEDADLTVTDDNKASSAFLGGTSKLVSFVPNTIWRAFMIAALAGTPDAPFPPPGPACDAPG